MVKNLLIPDSNITSLEIELFNRLPVELVLGGRSRTNHEQLGNILLNNKINEGIFLKQNIGRLNIEELLGSIVEKFKEEEADVKP